MTAVPPSTDQSPAADAIAAPERINPAELTKRFFAELHSDTPEHMHTLLWTLQDKRSTWVPLTAGPDTVASAARRLADSGKDVYCAVSAAAQPGLPETRIKSANSAGIMGLWADIDIADPDVHKKWNLPPTIDAALALLDSTGVDPTIVVHSGHGLQAWWLFHEFWAFDSDDQRLAAAGLAQRWNTTLQARAAERSWVVDSTFDLARVMRVPGTLNRKGTPVMPVTLIAADGPRYSPDDIDAHTVDETFLRGVSAARSYQPDDVEVSEARQPDFERFQALIDNDPVFEATWRMKRKDMPDQSPSSYDFSLAIQAVKAAWTDQEITDLIIGFRRNNRLDMQKALRPDYCPRTIAKARDAVARDASTEELDDVVEALEAAKRSGDDEQVKDARRAGLDVVSSQLGIEVLHFIKYLSEPPAFALVTPVKTIDLGAADGILVWAKFKQAVWESVGHSIPRFKATEWDRITQVIPAAWEEADVGSEATDRGEVAAWLGQYLSQRPPVDTIDEAAASEYPFKDESGRVVMFGPAFRRWLYLTYQERVNHKQLGKRLRAFGCEPDKVNVEEAGRRTSRSVWRLPQEVS
jgi:hypothetical protein